MTYDRGGVQVTLSVTRGATRFEQTDESGMTVGDVSTDFIFGAADLILNSVVVLPKKGDKILVTEGNQILHFEVLELGQAGHYRLTQFRKMLRVHTKHVDTT